MLRMKFFAISALCVLGYGLANGQQTATNSTYYEDGRDDIKQVVYDSSTGLMWQDDGDVKTVKKTWPEAINTCKNLSLGGYVDWRLPAIKDLETILDIKNSKPVEPKIKSVFKNAVYAAYWSGTPHSVNPSSAWAVLFNQGYSFHDYKFVNHYFRCVRNTE